MARKKKIRITIEITPDQGEALLRMAERGFLPDRLRWRDAEDGIAAFRSALILANAVAGGVEIEENGDTTYGDQQA